MKTTLMAVSAATLVACFDGGPVGEANGTTKANAPSKSGGDAGSSAVAAQGGGGSSSGGSAAASGLPCDVDQLLASHCRACHSNPPVAGAPMPLVTYDDLVAPAKSDPTKKVAELALTRIADDAAPMPPSPSPRVGATEIAALEGWVKGGFARGSCGSDAGPSSSPPSPLPPSATVCTSGTYWTSGDHGSPTMHPGGACITCHAGREEAPLLAIGGTVFPTLHEPIDCNGATGAISVVITDANGQEITLSVNSAGNFLYQGPLATPYRARVVSGGAMRAMPVAQTSGDCNSCHTQNGANGAPGRVVRP